MKIDDLRRSFGQVKESVSSGWERLRKGASETLTRFNPGEKTAMPARSQMDDFQDPAEHRWAMLGGDVFEDDRRLVVKLELPGLSKEDLDIQVFADTLLVRGEKRFQSESTEGRWRVMQCAYGSFQRAVPLPVAVRSDESRASYRDGVLRIERPKRTPGRPKALTIKVA